MTNDFLKNFKTPCEFFNHNSNVSAEFQSFKIPQKTIYLDFASSTPVDMRVFEVMKPWYLQYFGNDGSRIHPMGELSEHGLAHAREIIAQTLNVDFSEVYFTSSATESNNLVLRGLIQNPFNKRKKILYSSTEHSSVVETCIRLKELYGKTLGVQALELPVDKKGQIVLEKAKKMIDDTVLCVCVMDVNNETGVIQNQLIELEKMTHRVGAYLHVDAVQGFARSPVFACGVNYDTAVISSGKIYGPKGASALIIRKRHPKIQIEAQLTGGSQEQGLRASTPNIPVIMGFANACYYQNKERVERFKLYSLLESLFLSELSKNIDFMTYGLSKGNKVSGILSICIPGVNAMVLIERCVRVCVSAGSACKTSQATSSHVLASMNVSLEESLASFRISFGLTNTFEEVREAARIIAYEAKLLREESATF